MSDGASTPEDPKLQALGESLRGLHDTAQVPPPDDVALTGLEVFVGSGKRRPPPHVLVFDLSKKLMSKGLFVRNGEIGIVAMVDGMGRFVPMTPHKFVTWLPMNAGIIPHCGYKVNEESGKRSMTLSDLTVEQAKLVLQSEEMLTKLPKLNGLNQVKQPALSDDGKLRLLQEGYDVGGTGIYTLSGFDYPEDMDFQEAVFYLHELFRYFGWRSDVRDFPIHLAALLTMYCRGIYVGKAPMFVYNANIQESGKSTLATYVSWLVHGSRRTKPLLKDEEAKLEQTLNSEALAGSPFTIFDNVNWGNHPVESPLLDQWLTNNEADFRKLGGNEMAYPKLRGMTIMTGNVLKLSTDLQRRSLIIDLLNALPGSERVLPKGVTKIDARFFEEVENRKRGLAALWAIVREWDAQGRPVRPGGELGSFEGWSGVIPGIVWHVGSVFKQTWDCMAPSSNEEIGDKEGAEFKQLAEQAIGEFGRDEEHVMRDAFEINVQQLAGVARRSGLATRSLYPHLDVESVLQSEGEKGGWRFVKPKGEPEGFDPDEDDRIEPERRRQAAEWLTPGTRSSFGNAVKGKLHERHFRGPDGEYYEFAHRKGVSPARYLVTRVKRKR